MSILNVVSVSVPSLFAASPSSSAAFPSRNFLPFSPLALPERRSHGKALAAASAAVTDQKVELNNGALFHAFEEIQRDAFVVPAPLTAPLARQGFSDECEAAINDQINVEFNVSYAYHAMYAYFDRDNVAYKGLANFFKGSSVEERRHAEMLMDYQNKRGGRVRFYPVMNPPSEFSHPEKGDALYSMELALSLEKLVNEKLLNLHTIADRNNDPHLAGYIESEFLSEQVESIKKLSDYVAQLKRIGNGNGVWSFDRMLLN